MEKDQRAIVKVKLKEKDFLRFSFTTIYRQPFFSLISVLMILIACFSITRGINEGLANVPVTAWIFPILFLIVIPASLYFTAKRSFRNRLYHEEKTYHIDAEGVQVHSESIQAKYRWEDFKKVRYTGKALYLYMTGNAALLIPKSSIPSDCLDSLKSLIKERVPRKKGRKYSITLYILVIFLVLTGIIHIISEK